MLVSALSATVGNFPIYAIFLIAGAVLTVVVFAATRKSSLAEVNEAPSFYFAYTVVCFVVAIVWIYLVANEVVGLLKVRFTSRLHSAFYIAFLGITSPLPLLQML